MLSVPRDRIRTVDVTAHWLPRLLGLVALTIGTGQSDRRKERGLTLDGLTTADAARLRDQLLHRRPGPAVPAREVGSVHIGETLIARMTPGWLRYGPFTLSGVVTIGVLVGFGWQLANQAHLDVWHWRGWSVLADTANSVPLPVAIAAGIVIAALVVGIASAAGYALAFWGYRLTRHPSGTLHVTRGLITTRATTIEEARLRGVEISEPLLLRAVRGARCIAITTGLRVGRGAERGGSLLVPPAARAEVVRVATDVLRGTDPLAVPLAPHGAAARRRRYLRALVGALVLIGAGALLVTVTAGWPSAASVWFACGALLVLAAAALLARDRYASLGHALLGRDVVIRKGTVVRRTYLLDAEGIIGWNLRQSFFQRRANVLTLRATTAAGRQRYDLPDLDPAAALAVADGALPGLLAPFLART